MQIEKININKIKPNKDNPRIIKDYKFKKLVNSIKEFPEMLKIRPIVVNDEMIVLGGNQRLKACKDAGLKEVYIINAKELTEEQQKEFIIKDNVNFGEWDLGMLKIDFDKNKLENWGLELKEKDKKEDGEIVFSQELDEESNYIILKFTKDIDFLYIQTLLNLGSSYSKRANGKEWAKGIGRVIDGIKAINLIKGK